MYDDAMLRLAIALAHAIPSGRIEIRLADGAVVEAAHGFTEPGVFTLCDLRASLIMGPMPCWLRAVDNVGSVTIGGTGVTDLGGGVYGRGGDAERWFGTLLAPSTVERMLESCPIDAAETITASLRVDGDLGVTAVMLSTDDTGPEPRLDETARWMRGRVLRRRARPHRARRTMNVDAPSRPRVVGPYTTFVTSVARTARLGANFMRVTLAGGDLVDFAPVGPDTFAYLLLPPPGRRDLSIDASFTWDLYRELPELDRPVGAYYTIRAWRPEAAEVDLDMVLHGDAGAGSAWATQARPGDPVALWGPRALYTPVETDEWQLLVGDETTLPAIATILESLDASARAIAVIEIGNETERQPLESAADVEIHWVDRGAAPAGTSELLVEKVRTLELPTTKGYAWGGGESHSMTAIRRHLRDVCGLPATDVCVVAYWRHADHAPDDDD